MPSRDDISYFGAGPAPLPTAVIEAGAAAFTNFNDTGLGLAEISHRSPTANAVLAETKDALSTLLDIPDNYEIIFMQGGGSGGFSAVVQNLVPVWIERRRRRLAATGLSEEEIQKKLAQQVEDELKIDYLVTGSWSLKASQEASRLIGSKFVNVAVDARKSNGGKFGTIPDETKWELTKTKKEGGTGSAFVYYCDNETVDGVEFPSFPKSLESQGHDDEEDERLVVCDMSSNFISRKVDVSKYAVIFVSPFARLHTCQYYTNLFLGRCSKEHRHHWYHDRHHPQRPPPTSHRRPLSNSPPLPTNPRSPRNLCSRLRHDCQEQLSLQHPSDLQPLDCRRSDESARLRIRGSKGFWPRIRRRSQGEAVVRYVG